MKIKVIDVSKKIKKNIILDNINLEFNSGKVYGLVGKNGSGKTMLLRALSGLMHIDEGKIMLDDKILHKDFPVMPGIGITIENAGLYPEFTGFNNLKILAKINNRIGNNEIKSAMERVGLDPDDKRTVRKYSLGMKQKIVIAQAIMEKPDILLLDEPTNALDTAGVELVRNIIVEEKRRGAIIVLASHNKTDIELLADEIIYIENGKIKEGAYEYIN